MAGNNGRAAQGGEGVAGGAAGVVDSGDWRTELQPHSRQRIINFITTSLTRHIPVSGQEGVQELKNIAVTFEERMYSAATSEQQYLRKISLTLLNMETKPQNFIQPNPASSVQNAFGAGSDSAKLG